jgi:hypothetical protein
MMTGTNELGTAAAKMTMKGAADYLATHKLAIVDDAAYDTAAAELRIACHAAFDEAFGDAKAAIDANMTKVAAATFNATMRLAGITTAKGWLAAGIAR